MKEKTIYIAYPNKDHPRYIFPVSQNTKECIKEFYFITNIFKKIVIELFPYCIRKFKFILNFHAIKDKYLFNDIRFITKYLGEIDLKEIFNIGASKKEIELAIYLGSEGKFNKITVLITDKKCYDPIKIVKIALTDLSKKSLLNELKILKKLQKYEFSSAVVPEVSEYSCYQDYLVVKYIYQKGYRYSNKFDINTNHILFLKELFINSVQIANIKELIKYKELINKIRSVENSFNSNTKKFLIIMKDRIEAGIDKLLPYFGIVHGDFKPWNIKSDSFGKLLVFDWEWAEEKWIPFYDLFHYLLNIKNYSNLDEFLSISEIKKYSEYLGIETKLDLEQLKIYFFIYALDYLLNYTEPQKDWTHRIRRLPPGIWNI